MSPDAPLRIVQWTTGNVARQTVRAILCRADLELVGVYAHSPEKVGVDVADLCRLGAPVGLTATDDVDALLDADTLLRRCSRVPADDSLGSREPVSGAVRRAAESLRRHLRDELEHFVEGQLRGENSERALQADGLAEAAHVVVRIEQEEVAVLMKVYLLTYLFLKVFKQPNRLNR